MNKRLIIIEDDAAAVLLLKRYIKHTNWSPQIHHFEYGIDAIDYFKDNQDADMLVLLDLNLPDMAGSDILKFIRSHADIANTPVIVLTTSNLAVDKQACNELGVTHFLEKPIDFEILVNILIEHHISIEPL